MEITASTILNKIANEKNKDKARCIFEEYFSRILNDAKNAANTGEYEISLSFDRFPKIYERSVCCKFIVDMLSKKFEEDGFLFKFNTQDGKYYLNWYNS